ncbi:MAG: c-type cytochrome biogenesis protein CcmI [Gammaproteobacteria bacterium]|nr:c-type cytochrome biogenesis protein CcmI [Gammaproteobacteria bacterium]
MSFRDDTNESNRRFHRARLEEIPDLVSSGLIHSDQLTAIESESKHDLLSDMRGSEAAPASQITLVGRHRGGLLAALLVGVAAVGLYADFGASMGRVQEVTWTEALEALDLSRAADVENAYELMKQWRDANQAADSLSALSIAYPMDRRLTVQSLEARYLADNRVMSAALKADFDDALSRYPNEIGLLEIAGMEAHKAGDVGTALGLFRRAAEEASGPRRNMIEQVVQVLASGADIGSLAAPDGTEPEAGSPNQQPVIEVTVDLTSDIALPKQSRLFVFARAINGPPMPLAVVRAEPTIGRSVYRLDDSLAMMPSLTLSQFPEVELVARWSRSGQIVDDGNNTETILSSVTVEPGLKRFNLSLHIE